MAVMVAETLRHVVPDCFQLVEMLPLCTIPGKESKFLDQLVQTSSSLYFIALGPVWLSRDYCDCCFIFFPQLEMHKIIVGCVAAYHSCVFTE